MVLHESDDRARGGCRQSSQSRRRIEYLCRRIPFRADGTRRTLDIVGVGSSHRTAETQHLGCGQGFLRLCLTSQLVPCGDPASTLAPFRLQE